MANLLYGRKAGVLIGAVSAAVIVILAQFNLVSSIILPLYIFFFILAHTVTTIIDQKIHPVRGFLFSGVILLILSGSYIGIWTLTLDKPFKSYLIERVEKVAQDFQSRKAEMLAQGGKEARELLDFFSRPDRVAEQLIWILPGFVLVSVFFTIWINFLMVLRTFSRVFYLYRTEYPYSIKDLLNFKVPEYFIWTLAAALAITLWGDSFLGEMGPHIGKTLLYCIGVFYFFQGFGIYLDFLDFIQLGGLIRSFLVIFTVITGSWFLAGLGLFDVWFNFKDFFHRKRQERNKGE